MQERPSSSPFQKTRMEKRLKQGICRLFSSSLRSCQSQALSDVAQGPIFLPRNSRHIQSHPSVPPHRSFPSLCRPKSTEPIIGNKPKSKNRRLSQSAMQSYNTEGRRCPPPSPASPFSPCQLEEIEMKKKKKTKKKKKKKKDAKNNEKNIKTKKNSDYDSMIKQNKGKEISDSMVLSTSSDSRRFFSSDDEVFKDAEPFYSSDSSYSFSSFESQRPRRSRNIHGRIPDVGVRSLEPILATKAREVQESVAVVKSSDDPYGDFRRSMVEMITEKRIYTAEGLEKLLGCFLSLNSPFHHRVIVEVFSEILEAMFPH